MPSNQEVQQVAVCKVSGKRERRRKKRKDENNNSDVNNNNNNNNKGGHCNGDVNGSSRPSGLTKCQSEALQEVRDWLLSQPQLRLGPLASSPSSFALRFLRFRGFRAADACAVADRYVHMRQAHPEWFRALDFREDPALRRLMGDGYLLVLPEK